MKNVKKMRNSKPSTLPPQIVEELEQHIRGQSQAPVERLERLLSEWSGRGTIKLSEFVEASRLRHTFVFTDDRFGELGRIDAIYSGEGLSLKALYCGVCDAEPNADTERGAMMMEIYEMAKTAFTEA
jgi:hypothetical protein